jgi:DNA replication protein
MKKIGDYVSLDHSFKTRKQTSVKELYSKPVIKKFLEENKLTKKAIEDNWIDFLEYYDDFKICEECESIDNCPKNFKGRQYNLEYENQQIKKSFKVCSCGEEFNKEVLLLTKIVRNVPDKLLKTTFKDIALNNDGNISEVLIKLNKYLESQNEKGFYLYGEMGVGKTYIMAALINSLAIKGNKCAFISVPELFARLKREFSGVQMNNDILADIKEVPYLVLDDLGAELLSPWARDDVLYTIINERMNRALPTFFTSVYDLNNLLKHYMLSSTKEERLKAMRIIERIKAISEPLELNGKNFR